MFYSVRHDYCFVCAQIITITTGDAMDFNFVTPQISLNTMTKSGSVDSLGQSDGGDETVSNLFVNKLHQILARNGINNNEEASLETTRELTSINSTQLLKEMNSAQGVDFLTKLKQYLMASGYTELNKISLGDEGLEAIKSMLVKAGFAQSQLSSLIKKVKSESEDGNVLVSDLMNSLLTIDSEELSTDLDSFSITDKGESELNHQDNSAFMDISAIPFITSIMKSLGVPDNTINLIVSDSDVKGEGIGLNTLITDLQELQEHSFYMGKKFQNSSDLDSIKEMFNQLGLSTEKSSGNGAINLGDFVSALEELRLALASEEDESTVMKSSFAEISISDLKKSSRDSSLLTSALNTQVTGSNLNDLKKISRDSSSFTSYIDTQVAGSSLNDLKKSNRDSSALISSLETEVISNDVKADSLIGKLMGDLHVNDISVKAADESQSDGSEMKYLTLKSVNHQLLMNLSVLNNNSEDVEKAILETDSALMIEKLHRLSGQDVEASPTPSNKILQNLLSSQENMNKTRSKNSSDLLDEALRKKIINLSHVQEEQNRKSDPEALVGRASGITAGNGDLLSGLINSIISSDTQTSAKRSGQNGKVNNAENDLDSILSRVEKKESLNILAYNQSDSSFSGGSDTKESASGMTKYKSTSSVLPYYVTNQVGKSIARAFSRGESEITLQLKPAELGRISMTIESAGDTLKVRIMTENLAAKDILSEHANDLKASLAGNGINLDSFDVEMSSDFKQSMADSGQNSNSSSDSGKNRGSAHNGSSYTGELEGSAVPNFFKNEDNMLHLVA